MWEWNDVQWTRKFKNRKLRSTKEKYNYENEPHRRPQIHTCITLRTSCVLCRRQGECDYLAQLQEICSLEKPLSSLSHTFFLNTNTK